MKLSNFQHGIVGFVKFGSERVKFRDLLLLISSDVGVCFILNAFARQTSVMGFYYEIECIGKGIKMYTCKHMDTLLLDYNTIADL